MALSDSSGDTVQTYEYSVYGQVAAEDPNHPNPYMFTGRRFDAEIGLYYYRARYYDPFTGRFLQTDPIGYGDGMNWYAYCGNSPLNSTDPSGLVSFRFKNSSDSNGFYVEVYGDNNDLIDCNFVTSIEEAITWLADLNDVFTDDWMKKEVGWDISGGDKKWFWRIHVLAILDEEFGSKVIGKLDEHARKGTFSLTLRESDRSWYTPDADRAGTLEWDPDCNAVYPGTAWKWYKVHPLVLLAHELAHARDHSQNGMAARKEAEIYSVRMENRIRHALFRTAGESDLYPRPGYRDHYEDLAGGRSAQDAWSAYNWRNVKW